MRKLIGLAAVVVLGVGCASLTPQGAAVKVYQADVADAAMPAPPMPDGCKLVAASEPIDQQEQERNTTDPYRPQRNATADKGGNVLLVKSSRFKTLKRTECSESDPRNCPDSAQNWYKVSFGSYACDATALAVLAEAKPPAGSKALFEWTAKKSAAPVAAAAPPSAVVAAAAVTIPPGQPAAQATAASSTTAAVLKSKILALVQEGVGTDVIVSYVRANRLPAALTAEEIIEWKKAGIPDDVIRATFPN